MVNLFLTPCLHSYPLKQVQYNPSEVPYEDLLAVFFARIDPTQVEGQSPDFGPQYRTGVYYHTSEQQAAVSSPHAPHSEYIDIICELFNVCVLVLPAVCMLGGICRCNGL